MSPAASTRFKAWLKTKTRQRVAIPEGGEGNAERAAKAAGNGMVKVRAVNRLGWVAETKLGLMGIDYAEMTDEQAEKMMAAG